jgi:hypothetical protein
MMTESIFGLILPLYMTDGLNITTLVFEFTNIINSLLNQTKCEEMLNKLEICPNMHELLMKRGFLNDNVKNEVENERNNRSSFEEL